MNQEIKTKHGTFHLATAEENDRMELGMREKEPKPEKKWLKKQDSIENPPEADADLINEINNKTSYYLNGDEVRNAE